MKLHPGLRPGQPDSLQAETNTTLFMTYQEAITELETLLAKLQEVPADIDQLHARVARAEVLVAACRAQLRGVEEALNKLDKTTGE